MTTKFYSDLNTLDLNKYDLLVTDESGVDINEWLDAIKGVASYVIPPYDPSDSGKTSQCADLAKLHLKDNVGVVVAGRSDAERQEFFLWAQEQGYSPIVLLPHARYGRQRQIMQLSVPKFIERDTWIHLPEPVFDFDEHAWPGRYTIGEEFHRNVRT
jgi:hypothetical protein